MNQLSTFSNSIYRSNFQSFNYSFIQDKYSSAQQRWEPPAILSNSLSPWPDVDFSLPVGRQE
jgi:hypothetical protein